MLIPAKSIKIELNPQTIRKKLITYFLDIIILKMLEKKQLSGYDVISLVLNKYGTLLSSGSIYSKLHALEREQFVKGEWTGRVKGEGKRVYTITDEGKEMLRYIKASMDPWIVAFRQLMLEGTRN